MFRQQLKEPQNSHIEFSIEHGKFQGFELKAEQISPCMEPTCGCSHIYFRKANDASSDYYSIDVEEKKVTVFKENKPLETDLTKTLSQEVSEKDWNEMFQFFYNVKISLCEMIEPEKVNFEFTKEEKKSIEQGVMYPFHQIFPWGYVFSFQVENETFNLFDYYCLRSNCDCTETTFYIENENSEDESLGLTWNYINSDTEISHSSEKLSEEKKQAILNALKAELIEKLKSAIPQRHARLKRIYAHYLLTEKSNPIQDKIGRNDPCPCGSGKKYKNCHGA